MIPIPALCAIPLVILAAVPSMAECLANVPSGLGSNVVRPSDRDAPAAGFSAMNQLNNSLPSWLCLSTSYRARAERFSGGMFRTDVPDSYLLGKLRLGVLIKPATWLHVYAELQDARVFWKNPPVGPPHQNTWDLRRAFVDFGDYERDRISFRLGRQDIHFGGGRLLGTPDWRNATRGYDAAMVVARWKRIRVNAFAASQVVVLPNGLSHHQPGNNIHGVYGSAKNLIPGSDLEPFFFWRLAPRVRTERGPDGKLDERAMGLRWSGAASRWDYIVKAAGQVGSAGPDSIRAWALTANAGYTFPVKLRPRLFVEYDFASGDRNPRDGVRGTFDHVLPNVHGRNGMADQVAWQNLKEVRAGIKVALRRNWNVATAYSDWRLASATDAFYSASGAMVARDPQGRSGTHIGEEFDLETSYRINREIEFGGGIGRIFPGAFLARTNRSRAFNYPYVMLTYNFF